MQTTTKRIKFLPKHGDLDSLFDRLASYVSDIDNEWLRRIKPASRKNIDALIRVSKIGHKGLDLPESYRIFLTNMGENDGGLLRKHLLVDSSISEICEYYEEENEYEPESINPEILVIGFFFETGSQLSLDLRCLDEPQVVISTDGEVISTHSYSLEKLLFQNAFLECEKRRFSEYVAYSGSKNMLKSVMEENKVDDIYEVVEKYAMEYDYCQAWFNDENHFCGYRNDAAFMVEKQGGVILTVYGDDKKFTLDFGSRLSNAIGAEPI